MVIITKANTIGLGCYRCDRFLKLPNPFRRIPPPKARPEELRRNSSSQSAYLWPSVGGLTLLPELEGRGRGAVISIAGLPSDTVRRRILCSFNAFSME
jgi:hypothetical protein